MKKADLEKEIKEMTAQYEQAVAQKYELVGAIKFATKMLRAMEESDNAAERS